MANGRHRHGRPSVQDARARQEAIQIDKAASASLAAAQERAAEIGDIVTTLRRIRERNHFGEMVRRALT